MCMCVQCDKCAIAEWDQREVRMRERCGCGVNAIFVLWVCCWAVDVFVVTVSAFDNISPSNSFALLQLLIACENHFRWMWLRLCLCVCVFGSFCAFVFFTKLPNRIAQLLLLLLLFATAVESQNNESTSNADSGWVVCIYCSTIYLFCFAFSVIDCCCCDCCCCCCWWCELQIESANEENVIEKCKT